MSEGKQQHALCVCVFVVHISNDFSLLGWYNANQGVIGLNKAGDLSFELDGRCIALIIIGLNYTGFSQSWKLIVYWISLC